MKINQNQNTCKAGWMMCVNAMDVIKNIYLDNNKDEIARDAYYNLLHQLNNWYDEIEKMPF